MLTSTRRKPLRHLKLHHQAGTTVMAVDDVLKEVKTRTTDTRLWFGFPHYVVLGWAALMSYTVYGLVDWRDDFEHDRSVIARENSTALTELAAAIGELRESTSRLEKDAIRTRTIIELRFPETSQRVRDALSGVEK